MSVQTTLDEGLAARGQLPEVLLIDLSSLFWSAWHSSGEDEISQARRRTLEGVQRCIGDLSQGRLVAICCDSGRSFRKDLAPEYKAQRPEKDHASLAELDRVKAKLRDDGFLLWDAPGFEADDVIATATMLAVGKGHPVIVASADKDLLQLCWEPGPVRALRTHNWSIVGESEVEAKFGVTPGKLGDWLALVGDASDNIRGAPGIGPKTATNLLTKFGSLPAIFDALESKPLSVGTPSVVRSLQQNVEEVKLARRLVSLRTDAPIDFDRIYDKPTPKPSPTEDVDMDTPDPEFVDTISIGPGPAPISATRPEPPPAAPPPAPPPANGNGGNGMNGNGNGHEVALVPSVAQPVGPYELALEPTSLGVAFKLGQALYASRLYARFPSAEAITAVIIRGREMGLGALTALDVFHVIEGKPAPHAHFIIARGEAHPDCEYFALTHSDNAYAEYETKNRKHPKPIKHRYTIQDAVDAGLCGLEIIPKIGKPGDKDHRGNWDKRRAEMLRKTAGVQLVRIAYPSAALGLYALEELNGGAD